jgi:predicted GH43/DUF377 family glycosyl hydrolase
MSAKIKYNWEKLGKILSPNKKLWWMQTHAMVPTIENIRGSLYKVYFSGRDSKNVSYIGWASIDLGKKPLEIIEFSKEPVLSPGELGCFDDNGVTPSCVIKAEDKTYLYYIGWNPGHNVRMHLFGGLAISSDNGNTFERYSRAPIIERCKVNPFLNTAPFVIRDQNKWLMYYVSGVKWVHKDLPRYNIQIGTSEDGIDWKRDGKVAIDFKDDNEMALARPWVLKDKGVFKMWFSFKGDVKIGNGYRLGYAESLDGIKWDRMDDKVGITVSRDGWDSEMVEYAAVISFEDKYYMFYNGNDYGKNGIGIAVCERKE